MQSVALSFVGAVGIALVITALTMKDRQSPQVIDSLAWGATHLEEGALGQKPS